MITKDAVNDRKDLSLIALDDFAEGDLIFGLNATDKGRFFSVPMVHSGLRPGLLASSGKGKNSAQAIHTIEQTCAKLGRFQPLPRGSCLRRPVACSTASLALK